MNPNESDLNDVLMPASLSDDKIIKHMARRTLKLFVKNETPPKVTHEDLVKNRSRSPVRPPIPATAKTPDLPETSLNRDVTDSLTRNRISVRETENAIQITNALYSHH